MTGAAILVALIVLLVPELLSRPQHARPEQAAAVDEAPIRSYRLSLGDSQQSATPVPVVPTVSATAATPASAAPATLASAKPATPARATPAASDTARAGSPHGAAQVAASEPRGSGSRVAAAHESPAPDSAQPESQAARRKSAARLEKAASPPKAARADSAARTEHASGGWAVQVGSFASRENADRLVRSLKLKGYGAFITESPSRGRMWYRVRVGPERTRGAADAVAARLRAAGFRGAVAQAR